MHDKLVVLPGGWGGAEATAGIDDVLFIDDLGHYYVLCWHTAIVVVRRRHVLQAFRNVRQLYTLGDEFDSSFAIHGRAQARAGKTYATQTVF